MKRTPLKRKSAMKRRSKKGAKYEREFKALKTQLQGAICGPCFAGTIWSKRVTIADTLHHILPRSRGGKNEIDNLIPVCAMCHMWIHAHPAEAKKHGLLR